MTAPPAQQQAAALNAGCACRTLDRAALAAALARAAGANRRLSSPVRTRQIAAMESSLIVPAAKGDAPDASQAGACPLCGGAREAWLAMPIDAKTFAPTPYGQVDRCTVCGVAGSRRLPTPEEAAGFYRLDAYYTQGASHFAAPGRETFADRLRTHLAWRFDFGTPPSPPELIGRIGRAEGRPRVLDAGCGDGAGLDAFAAEGCDAVGLDPDETAAAKGRREGRDIRVGAAERAGEALAGERFDLIIFSHALEHCIDPVAALRSLRGLLREGGVLYCETPNCAALHFAKFNICSEMFDAPRHLWFFDPASLRATLERAGFAVESALYHGFARHFGAAWRATENRIRERLLAAGHPAAKAPPPHSRMQSARLLARAAFAPRSRKYDCVGMIARAA